MNGRVEVAGATTPEGLVQLATQWGTIIAGHLDRPPVADRISLEAHDRPGVAHVRGTTIHLFQGLDGEADVSQLPHELVHLVAGPCPSRFLGEGLAVHLAACVNLAEPCWPSYGAHPDAWVAELRRHGPIEPLCELVDEAQSIRLGKPDLTRAEFLTGWRLYLMAGSFAGYLFRTVDRGRFWDGYERGACWHDDAELHGLEHDWLAHLATSPLAEHVALVGAVRHARRQMDLVPWDPDGAPTAGGDEVAPDAAGEQAP